MTSSKAASSACPLGVDKTGLPAPVTKQARELAELLREYPCKINLIPFNDFPNSGYQRPSGNAVTRFWQVLVDAGFVVTVRTTRGDDIDAACGQLVGEVVDRTRRSARHRAGRGDHSLLQ